MASSFGYYSLTGLNLSSCGSSTGSTSIHGTDPVVVDYDMFTDSYIVSLYESSHNLINFAEFNKSLEVVDLLASSGSFSNINVASLTGNHGHFNTLAGSTLTFNSINGDIVTAPTGSFTALSAVHGSFNDINFKNATGTSLHVSSLEASQAVINGVVTAHEVHAYTGAFDGIYIGPGGLTGPGVPIPPTPPPFDTSVIHCGYLMATGSVSAKDILVSDKISFTTAGLEITQDATSVTLGDPSHSTGAHTVVKALGGPYNIMSNIEPYYDDTYSLGSVGSRWLNSYSSAVHTNLGYIKQDSPPATTNRLYLYDPSLGDSGGFSIRSPAASVMTINTTAIPQPVLQLGTSTIQHHGSILPDANVTWDIGSSGRRYGTIWCNTLHVANNTIQFEGGSSGAAAISSEYISVDITGPDGNVAATLQGYNISSDYVSATGVFTDFTTSYLSTTEIASSFIVSTTQLRGNTGAGFTVDDGAGIGASVSYTGSCLAGLITLDTGSGCTDSSVAVRCSYEFPMTGGSFVSLTPYNRFAAVLLGNSSVHIESDEAGFTVNSGESPLEDYATYKWSYTVLG